MKKEVIPVIVSTVEALENALAEQCPVLCVMKNICNQNVLQRLEEQGYVAGKKRARTVMIFERASDKKLFKLQGSWKFL